MKTDESPITIELEKSLSTAATPTRRVCQVASMFGIGVDDSRRLAVLPRVRLTLRRGRVVFVTGASGGGKSLLLRCLREELTGRDGVRVIETDCGSTIPARRTPLIEAIGGSLQEATRWLSLAGLADAFVMLRNISELSDGQRYRWRLARAIAAVERGSRPLAGLRSGLVVVIADEFGSTLDRLTAAIVARNFARWVRRSGVCLVAATAHDDLIEHLEPDVVVVKGLGDEVEVISPP